MKPTEDHKRSNTPLTYHNDEAFPMLESATVFDDDLADDQDNRDILNDIIGNLALARIY